MAQAALTADEMVAGLEKQPCCRIAGSRGPGDVAVELAETMWGKSCRDWLDKTANFYGWYVTRIVSNGTEWDMAYLEPIRATAVPRPRTLFHATPLKHRASVLRIGISLGKKSRSWTDRTYYTRRAFFAVSERDAVTFLQSHESRKPAIDHRVLPTWAQFRRWEMFAVKPGGRIYREDNLLTTARWTDRRFAPRDIKLVPGWRKKAMELAKRRARFPAGMVDKIYTTRWRLKVLP